MEEERTFMPLKRTASGLALRPGFFFDWKNKAGYPRIW
jgi:hypothetical protein